jgi:hypothetical protein
MPHSRFVQDRGRHIVVIGNLEVTRRTVAQMQHEGYRVTHLPQPNDADLFERLMPPGDRQQIVTATPPDRKAGIHDLLDGEHEAPVAVAILVRGDVVALRYALLVAHIQPQLPLVVTIFDRTLTEQLRTALPHCVVTSPADEAVPAIATACVAEVDPPRDAPTGESAAQSSEVTARLSGIRVQPPRTGKTVSTVLKLSGALRPPDLTSRMLLAGTAGLLLVLLVDWLLGVLAFHRSVTEALLDSVLVLATVSAPQVHPSPAWYQVDSALMVLLTIALTALFTAGLVGRATSSRSVGLFGRRLLPRSNHVVVVGLGQVGLRLCLALRSLDVPVVAVERDPAAANLRLARSTGIAVVMAHAEDRDVLDRLALSRARAVAAMGSVDIENVEVALAVLAVAPQLPVVIRAGEDDVIAETRSLFHIGQVIDVSTLTALAVTRSIQTALSLQRQS